MNLSVGHSITSPEVSQFYSFKPKIRLGVMASGSGTNFEALINAIKNSKLDAEIKCLVVNNSKCKAIEKAQKYNIPYVILDHRSFESRESLDREIIEYFESYKIEGIVMAGWMRIVTSTLINKYPNRLVNIHPSLLPSFPGNNAIKQALESGVKITGCSVHLVKEKVDSGPILIQSAVPIFESDNENILLRRVQKREHKILYVGVAIAARLWRE
ncbi:phosphoribosylglycinamide formyltransferase [Prochlorococcus marinus]|uniref:Phosphoribosylglycinamide formyltransferase n=1 Tax=Prochlorococcus marinus (strain MIT 9211) TaxID=93059 RepID=A9BAE2_PROM4|nr:phosphoribosylglycinamide formyltransferase [Prochlorococcus marinus]ABX08804.1 phosphoribosylglycinamide formyltransferase [Prochlorococcus marinus str. MIT 9211]